MLTPTFNQTYTVRLAVQLPGAPLPCWGVGELAKSLQTIYDADAAPAGQFELELLGHTLIVTLLRDIAEDLAGTNRFADDGMTADSVQEQLAAEYHYCLDNLPEGALGQAQVVGRLILDELTELRAKVEGLPHQMTKVRLVCEWIMPAGTTMEQVRKALHDHREMVDLVSIRGAERETAEFYVEVPGAQLGTYTLLDLVNP